MDKDTFFRCLYGIAALMVLAVSTAQGVWAAPLPQDNAYTNAWEAYDAGRIEEALNIWQRLADKGHVDAQVNLGIIYDSGQGVAQDPAAAARWYLRAAEAGHAEAQYSLGLMFAMGRGVAGDKVRAGHWFYRAAAQDLPMAQYELGLLFAKGLNPVDHPWRPAPDPKIDDDHTATDAGDKDALRMNLAVKWFYRSGVTYLATGDSKGAWQALEAIRCHSENHPLKAALQKEILSCISNKSPDKPSSLYAGASIGTAWPIATGYVVTNNHVVEDSRSVMLITESGDEIPAWAVLRDKANDIALLEVKDATRLPPAIPLSGDPAGIGSSVFTVGFPRIDEMGDTPKQSQGVISELHGLRDDHTSYQTTVPIHPGNSGGPLINMRGEAVGVVKAMIGLRKDAESEVEPLPNASCALKIECVKDLARLLPRQEPQLGELPYAAGSLQMLAERVKGSVLIVVAR